VAGVLLQACSDNNGSTGPTFACREGTSGGRTLAECVGSPAPTTGFANTSAEIRVQVAINPNTITPGRRAGITAIVTNLNGQPLAGKNVNFTTDVGTLDNNEGVTNKEGKSSTTLSITAQDVANATAKSFATVIAFVDGASGSGIVNFGPNPTPAPLTLSPSAVALTQTGAPTCTFNAQFTAAGGTPPLTFSSGIPGAVNGTGLYSQAGVAAGTNITDTVTVTDSAGQTASASVSLTCL
jgi:hypothetical protein